MAVDAVRHSFIQLPSKKMASSYNMRAGSGVELQSCSVYAVVTSTDPFAQEELQSSSSGIEYRSLQSHLRGKREREREK